MRNFIVHSFLRGLLQTRARSPSAGRGLPILMTFGSAMALLFLLPTSASASGFSSRSLVETSLGGVNDSGGASSAVAIDADNFASSFVDPQRGKLGATASNGLIGRSSSSRSKFDDSWTCNAPCGSPPLGGIVPLALLFKLDGVLTDFHKGAGFGTGEPSAEITASYAIGGAGSFDFLLQENMFDIDTGPLGAGSVASAVFCTQRNTCTDLPVVLTRELEVDDAGHDQYRFSLDLTINQFLCPNCFIGFVDDMSLSINAVGGSNGVDTVSAIDALHTFQVTVTSLDPTMQFTSALGRTTAAPTTTVPEPSVWWLLAGGLVALAWQRQRGQARLPVG